MTYIEQLQSDAKARRARFGTGITAAVYRPRAQMPAPATVIQLQTAAMPRLLPGVRSALIINATATHYAVQVAEMTGPSRIKLFKVPRFLAMWICAAVLPHKTFGYIANLFNRDHTTVYHAVRCVDKRLAEFESDLIAIGTELGIDLLKLKLRTPQRRKVKVLRLTKLPAATVVQGDPS